MTAQAPARRDGSIGEGHDWRRAGEAWGRRAADWAYLCEPGAALVYDTVLDRLAVGPGVELLDVGCGAGGAVRLAGHRGARVSGIDASEALLEIARRRSPTADIRRGSMFDLPFADGSFDAAASCNGIFGGCDAAVDELHRVVRPGGRVALTFWGDLARSDHVGALLALMALQPPAEAANAAHHASIGDPGVAEGMLHAAGFRVAERLTVPYTNEWPTVDVAVRALSSSGPAAAALRRVGPHHVSTQLRDAIEPYVGPNGDVCLTSPFDVVVAER